MTRFLIASWDGGGNTPSAFHLGSRLIRRGHRVRMLGWAPMAARAAAAGIEFALYPTAPAWPDDLVHEDGWDLLQECLQGAACRADVAAQARAFDADAVVVDCMLSAGFDAAGDLGLPTAALVHVSYQQFLHVWGDRTMGRDVRAMLAGTHAVLALQPPGFDADCPLPPGHEYVGAVGHPDSTRRLAPDLAAALAEPGEPWVLLSLSTTTQRGQLETLQTILHALAARPIRVLLTLGGPSMADRLDLPLSATVTGFVPHELLLPSMSAVVSHAGMSTVATCLGAGVPQVCLPLGRDQHGNAARIAAIGAGLAVEATGVAEALTEVLLDPRYAAAAQQIARACVPLRNGARAADLVETVASRCPGGLRGYGGGPRSQGLRQEVGG